MVKSDGVKVIICVEVPASKILVAFSNIKVPFTSFFPVERVADDNGEPYVRDPVGHTETGLTFDTVTSINSDSVI